MIGDIHVHFRAKRCCAILAGLVLAGLAGCGPVTGDVSGKVLFKGKEVRTGSVMFIGSNSLPVYSQIREDGTYSVSRVPLGQATITVDSPNPNESAGGGRPREGREGYPPNGRDVLPPGAKLWFPIPDSYSDQMKSPLTYTVQAGLNTFDIELK
jgi:hypothetical protein